MALDTSAAVPVLIATHDAHEAVAEWCRGRRLPLCGHAALETFSVLTRLPGDVRVDAADAVRLLARFEPPVTLPEAVSARLPEVRADAGVVGGAAYDGAVALTAVQAGVPLGTRDDRARSTYEALGARVFVVG
ncbi:PIN domain-containing protein [Pseudokineococcus lusitanus]|uniref:Ribonuclease VapC n=1 Tax=Pseudokineococcus lusitanus TaxID=763993 RepID=A0A3N1GWC2_9ACTN|nr:PIN domain-containing protein [Pseudokineococcus lusitanus]ROP34563.1 PIN domain-containing protein [Pseudokineococcus lusitanus]